MPRIDETLSGLHNGVSQQNPATRLDSQSEQEENSYPTLVDGNVKRPPTEFVALLDSNASEDTFLHGINRDKSERYLVIVTKDEAEPIEVYTIEGTKCTVRYGTLTEDLTFTEDLDVLDYAVSTLPRTGMKALTIADHTFLVNTAVTCTTEATEETTVYEALVYVKTGVQATDYKIYLGETEVTTYTSGEATDYNSYKTTTIRDGLYDRLVDGWWEHWHTNELDNLGNPYVEEHTVVHPSLLPEGFVITKIGCNALHITRSDNADFEFKTSDSWGEQALIGVKGTLQKFSDLPAVGKDGFYVEITGDVDNAFDNYYVKYDSLEDQATGVWRETIKPGLENIFTVSTMPHRLVRTGTNQFTFAPIPWADRKVGDEVSAPTPSFVDNTIKDIFFFKNRLGVLSADNVILTRAGEYYDFYPSTATDLLDDDPIDVSANNTQVSLLHNAIPFNNGLLLFSDLQQFFMGSGDAVFTPKSVTCDPTTAYETLVDCKPIRAGASVYFSSPTGNHSALLEYYVQPDNMTNIADDVTAHVPNYLPATVTKLGASTARDLIFAYSQETPNNLYVYKFFWQGTEKIQSAWITWTFDDEIVDFEVIENMIFMIQKKDSEVFLSKINLENQNVTGLDFNVHLDKRKEVIGDFNEETFKTTWTLPYSDSSTTLKLITKDTGNVIIDAVKLNNTTVEAYGDYSAIPVLIGKPYNHRYRFSQFGIKTDKGIFDSQIKLMLSKLTLSFRETGYFRVQVTPAGRSMHIQEYTGVVIGTSIFGEPTLNTGTKDFVIMTNSQGCIIEVINDTYLPSKFLSAGYSGFYTK